MKHNGWWTLIVCAGLLLMPVSAAGAAPAKPLGLAGRAPAAPRAPADVPFSLVSSGVSSFTITDPKVFWYSVPACNPARPQAPTTNDSETVQRIATYGSSIRLLYSHALNLNCPGYNPDVASNIVSDGSALYWMSAAAGGLVKLPVTANAGDQPARISTAVSGAAQLVLAQGSLFVLTQPGGNSILWRIDLATGAGTLLADTSAAASHFQTDGSYLYWLNGGTLEEWDLHFGGFGPIASGVTGYFPDGQIVFLGTGRSITTYSNVGNPSTTLYTSGDPTARIYDLAADRDNLFWFEDHTLACSPQPCFPPHDNLLYRAGGDGSNPTNLYQYNAGLDTPATSLLGNGDFLFWLQAGAIQRLPKDATALPVTDLVADGLEVTQGIQDLNQDVPLIRERDTYVRFYVHSAGLAVPGVTAYLYGSTDGANFDMGPLTPVNPAGQLLTVQPAPNRSNLSDSFLFELPYSWTETGPGPLYLRAIVNSNEDPLEPDYGNNTSSSPALPFMPSPRLGIYFVAWGYTLNGQTYSPRPVQDVLQTFSWLRRVYPLASAPGMLNDPTPGLRPSLWTIQNDVLGVLIQQPPLLCQDNECAAAASNSLMTVMRIEDGLPLFTPMYGMISDGAGFFPRGVECCGVAVSSGPTGSNTWGWDFDGSYADWYAGHEIGHSLGRQHPAASAANCGNSADDQAYPYPNGQIGPTSGPKASMEGFDVGDPSLGLPLAVYPGTSWYDVMSYCPNQWISDYNYGAMYNYMMAHPSAPAGAPQADQVQRPSIAGNWLAVYGNIVTGATANVLTHVPGFQASANSALLTRVRHLTAVASVPPLVAGLYAIQLFGAGNNLLASYPFTPGPATPDVPNWLPFTQVVTDVAGATQLRIVQLAGNATLAVQSIPAHAPTVSNVALVGAPNPVTGTVNVSWQANDPDGLPLTFDVLYSRDGGATVQPLKEGIAGLRTAVDTAELGGSGSAILRVVASDGVNTAQADSAPFTMENKPPQVMILAPANGTHRHWGQLINFIGQALDAQDGGVSGSGLLWSDESGPLSTGALLSLSNLPVGTHTITLKATDSANLSASASITVVIDDDLSLPGPTLSAGPTQFSWHFATSAAASQSRDLNLDNVGGGVLNWTASTDAPWLKLSAASGSAPADLTLTASPAGYQDGTTHTGHVYLNIQGGSPAQRLVVLVGMSVGGSAGAPPHWANLLYLPIARR